MRSDTTVFVVMDVKGKNLYPAKEFGNLQILLTGRESNCEAWNKLRTSLSSMREQDYLLLIGNPMFIAMASHLAMDHFKESELGVVQFLVWERERYEYRVNRTTDKSIDATTSH